MTLLSHRLLGNLVAAAVLAAVATPSVVLAQPASPTILQRIRQLIGLTRPLAAGGSRSMDVSAMCVVSPRVELDADGKTMAMVPLPRPTLLTSGALNEVVVERGGQIAWRLQASSSKAIESPIDWAIAPIQPDEQLTLRLRARGAAGGDFVVIRLIGVSAAEMAANEALAMRLGRDQQSWQKGLEALLAQRRDNLAMALMADQPGALRTELLKSMKQQSRALGCGS
jgi:hypothetical protein